jgi:hypothetical protein
MHIHIYIYNRERERERGICKQMIYSIVDCTRIKLIIEAVEIIKKKIIYINLNKEQVLIFC